MNLGITFHKNVDRKQEKIFFMIYDLYSVLKIVIFIIGSFNQSFESFQMENSFMNHLYFLHLKT